jgi:hypothetical protein
MGGSDAASLGKEVHSWLMDYPVTFTAVLESPAGSALVESPAKTALDAVPVSLLDIKAVSIMAIAPTGPYRIFRNELTGIDASLNSLRRFSSCSYSYSDNYGGVVNFSRALQGAGGVLTWTAQQKDLPAPSPWIWRWFVGEWWGGYYDGGNGQEYHPGCCLVDSVKNGYNPTSTSWSMSYAEGDVSASASCSLAGEYSYAGGFAEIGGYLQGVAMGPYFTWNGSTRMVTAFVKNMDGGPIVSLYKPTNIYRYGSLSATSYRGGVVEPENDTWKDLAPDGAWYGCDEFGGAGQAADSLVSAFSISGTNLIIATLTAFKPQARHTGTLIDWFSTDDNTQWFRTRTAMECEPDTVVTIPLPSQKPPFRMMTPKGEKLVNLMQVAFLLERTLEQWCDDTGRSRDCILSGGASAASATTTAAGGSTDDSLSTID